MQLRDGGLGKMLGNVANATFQAGASLATLVMADKLNRPDKVADPLKIRAKCFNRARLNINVELPASDIGYCSAYAYVAAAGELPTAGGYEDWSKRKNLAFMCRFSTEPVKGYRMCSLFDEQTPISLHGPIRCSGCNQLCRR